MSASRNALYRTVVGSGRTVTIASSSNTTDTVAMGSGTFAVQVSATGANCTITISPSVAVVAATATKDIFIKTTDFPQVFACTPGDKISTYGAGAGSLYVCEMSH